MKRNNIIIFLGLALLCLPIHISYAQGARYTGSYTKSSAVKYSNRSNTVIEGLDISGGSSALIYLYNCENVIIRNNKLSSSFTQPAIYLDNCRNITIIDNTIEDIQTGLKAHNSQGIKFDYNDVTNVLGGLKGGTQIGNMAQFDKVTGSGNSISYNACENISGQSSVEDVISTYKSHGTASSPIIVKGNWLRGGGPSTASGGIILGDFGGSYIIAEDNILVNPGQYGISIAGGNNMTIRNNKVFASRLSFNNVGIYAANWTEDLGKSYNLTVSNNAINYTHRDGFVNNLWLSPTAGTVTGWSTNKHDSNITASILPTKIIGRARSASPTPPSNEEEGGGGGTTPLPEDKPDTTPTPAPKPEDSGNNSQGNNNSGNSNPNIENDASISIYLNRYNRISVNVRGTLSSSAEVIATDSREQVVYRQPLKRFHTVLPRRLSSEKYTILVKNGNKSHQKTLHIN